MVENKQDNVICLDNYRCKDSYKAERDDELLRWARQKKKQEETYNPARHDELLNWARGI